MSAMLLLAPVLVLAAIDRKSIVESFNVVRTKVPEVVDNFTSPLQVGNGDFAFNVDNTGMQTLIPFNTLSSWAWHKDRLPENGERPEDYQGVVVQSHGRDVRYDLPDPDLPEISNWLSANPNRINLGRIGLKYKGETLSAIQNPYQILDVWNGVITSNFNVDGHAVNVITQGDFETDSVVFDIRSDLIASGDLEIELDFPYPPIHKVQATSDFEVFMGTYEFPLNHTTSIVHHCRRSKSDAAHIYHKMQEMRYFLNMRWPEDLSLSLTRDEAPGSDSIKAHRYTISPRAKQATDRISLTANYALELNIPPIPAEVRERNSLDWNRYWLEGGFVDLTASTNPKAPELQRRIILSQYAMRINSAATGQPPQESGLVYNGWWGKFHLEMVVWHCAQWATWGRHKYLDRIFPAVYETILPETVKLTQRKGWKGARWPKMTELVTKGGISPGETRAYLQWQQPMPMYLASLAYKAAPRRETLERWDRILTYTADYMADFAWYNNATGQFDLGPPIQGVTENSAPTEIYNLAYELAYWKWALDVACGWKEKLGKECPEAWVTVSENLAPPPTLGGLYAPWVGGGLNEAWWDDPNFNRDPRSVIMLQGFLPDTSAVDPEIGFRTSEKVAEIWTEDQIRGWGRNILAINSARIGKPERAIHHLTNYDRWEFGDEGFAHRSGPNPSPPPYFPGNGGFLLAVSYMTAGWEGSEGHAPGFPKDGSWVVKHEGMLKSL